MLQATINGFISGAIYGLIAVGLVLVYKGVRVFNFAQGEFGTIAAFVTWLLHTEPPGLPLGVAIAVGVLAATAAGLVLERLVVRPLLGSPRVILLVATAGVAVGLISLQLLLGEAEGRVLDPIFQLTDDQGLPSAIFFANVAISAQHLIILGVLIVMAVLLWWFFSKTDLGLAVLATSQDPLATRLTGISVNRVSAFVWGFAAFLGGLAGVLQASVPGSFVAPGFMTSTALLPAFTGAVLGGMTSLPGAFVGGLLVGIARDLGAFLVPTAITGGAELTVFTLLLLVLLIRPQGLLGTEA